MPVSCICLLCDQSFLGRGKSQPRQRVCPLCMGKYGSAASGPVCSFIRQIKRANDAGVPATLTWKEWQQTKTDFENCCAYCEHRQGTVMEHFIPLDTGGGGTCRENCLPACAVCNRRKGGKDPEKTSFSPATTERLRRYLDWRRRGIRLRREDLSEDWFWLLPPAWRRAHEWDWIRFTSYEGGFEKVMRPGPLETNILLKLQEVKWLQTRLNEAQVTLSHRIHWAVASDEARRLILRAEERLSQETLQTIRGQTSIADQWEICRAGPLQLRLLIDQSLSLP